MRPASEVAEAVMGSFYGNRTVIIEADRKQLREEVVREVCEWLRGVFGSAWLSESAAWQAAAMIEREFLGEKA